MKISQKPRGKKEGVLNSTFLHNTANTLHRRRSALKLHSFVRGVLRQLSIGFSPPGSGHVPRYEPPCPKISSKRHVLHLFAPPGAMDITNTQSHMLQHPVSSTGLFVAGRGKTYQKLTTTARLCVEERMLWHAI